MGVPIINYRAFRGDGHAALVETLGESLEKYGFVCVTEHGIDLELLQRAYSVAPQVFGLPEPVKAKYETPQDGRQRGFTAFGVEHAKDREKRDLKEFWQVGRDLPEGHPLHLSGDVPPNQFPGEVPEFEEAFTELFAQMEDFANRLLDGVGEYLRLPDNFFRDMVRDGNSVLRIIHYPGLLPTDDPAEERAAAHEDINLLTVLPASTQPGLQLLTRDGEWLPISPPAGVMICDTGDMMARITGGRLPATTHRVINPEGDKTIPRFSMPFFVHPNPDYVLTPIGKDSDVAPIKARDFLHERLVDIGVVAT